MIAIAIAARSARGQFRSSDPSEDDPSHGHA